MTESLNLDWQVLCLDIDVDPLDNSLDHDRSCLECQEQLFETVNFQPTVETHAKI